MLDYAVGFVLVKYNSIDWLFCIFNRRFWELGTRWAVYGYR